MTALVTPLPHAPAHAPLRAHRHHRAGVLPEQLTRPAPWNTWDPLALDAEGEPPREDHELPTAHPLTPPPLEEVCKVAGALTRAIAEVLLGIRPPAQVRSWLFEDVWHVVQRRAHLGQRATGGQPSPRAVQILRIHPCPLNERTCEVAVVLHDGQRVRAAALRLALHRRRWRAAAIRIG